VAELITKGEKWTAELVVLSVVWWCSQWCLTAQLSSRSCGVFPVADADFTVFTSNVKLLHTAPVGIYLHWRLLFLPK